MKPETVPKMMTDSPATGMSRREFLGVTTGVAAALPGLAQAAQRQDDILVKFGVLTDVQYADVEATPERDYRSSLPKLEQAVDDLSHRNLPFTLHLGDLIDRDWASFDPVLQRLERLGHPVRHVLGNHDFDVGENHLGDVTIRMGLDPCGYGSFKKHGVRWVMLDTNEISTYRHRPGSPQALHADKLLRELQHTRAANAKPWNGGISPEQLAWLDQQLSESSTLNEAAIVCGHHPLVSESGHQAWNAPAILKVLGSHRCVRAYLCGHQHPGGLAITGQGVPMITFRSVLGPPGVNAWSVLTLTRSHLHIEGLGREVSRSLRLPD